MRKVFFYILLIVYSGVYGSNWWPLPMDNEDLNRDTIGYHVGLSAMAGSGRYSAFWMQSNQNGCISLSPYSGTLGMGIVKHATRPNRWYDYSFALEAYGIAHSSFSGNPLYNQLSHFPVGQWSKGAVVVRNCHAHLRLYIVDISVGVMPLMDDMNIPLGTGSLLLSNNAPSMPVVRIGLDRWTAIPGLFGYAELKGGIIHAWLNDNTYMPGCKLHYKHIGLQLGGKLPVNISYEFHHAAQWGGYAPDGSDLGNDFRSFSSVFLANKGGSSYNESLNALGNHLGSQQWTLTAKGKGWKTIVYWQNLLEDNFDFIGRGHNLPDGRWGVSVSQSLWPFINRLTIEYVGTTDQSGPLHDQDGIIYAGFDNYYCNSIYRQGWNYYLRSLGTPLITSPIYNQIAHEQTLNNRVKAWHIGIGGDIYGFHYCLLGTYAQNYGRYNDKEFWHDMQSHNIALMLDIEKTVEKAWGLQFGLRIAADFGTQWGNQVSAMFTIAKNGILTNYK